MKIEEFYNFTRLFDVYGKLLSNKQYEVMNEHLNNDIGESELAGILGESRQSVHDAITKAKKQLVLFEEKCEFLKNQDSLKQKLVKAKALVENQSNDEAVCLIDEIIENN